MDPRQSVDEVRRACEKAAEINPNFPYAYNNIAAAYNTRARHEIEHGLDPRASLQEAIGFAQKGIQVAELSLWRARWLLRNGGSMDAELKKGLDRTREALALDPSLAEAVALQGLLLLAQSQTQSGPQRRALAEQARKALQDALAANRNLARRYAGFL